MKAYEEMTEYLRASAKQMIALLSSALLCVSNTTKLDVSLQSSFNIVLRLRGKKAHSQLSY